MPIRQTVEFNASTEKLYAALTSATEFSSLTGASADISNVEGGAFACFGGQITGRHIELVPNKRIIQAWRAAPWPDSIYSVVKLEFKASGDTTIVELEHTAYPDGGEEHLEAGWHKMYWDPLRAHVE